jgi:hypothetical protein
MFRFYHSLEENLLPEDSEKILGKCDTAKIFGNGSKESKFD